MKRISTGSPFEARIGYICAMVKADVDVTAFKG